MSYSLRQDPAPLGRGLFGAAGPVAAANEVAATLMPGGSRYETQKARTQRVRDEKAATRGALAGRGWGAPRGRGEVIKSTPAQTPRQQSSQSSLPTPPTDKSQR